VVAKSYWTELPREGQMGFPDIISHELPVNVFPGEKQVPFLLRSKHLDWRHHLFGGVVSSLILRI
jgi:hypothetical protein